MELERETNSKNISPASINMLFPDIQLHPKYEEICRCYHGNQSTRLQAFQVYMDLSECKGWWNTQISTVTMAADLNQVLISGHRSRTTERDYIIPVDSNGSLSHADIQQTIQAVQEQHSSNSVILALIDDNSSIIYYRATAALCPPDPAETVEAKHAKSRRIFERRKNRVHNLKESLKSYTCSGQSEEQEKDSVNISEEQDLTHVAQNS